MVWLVALGWLWMVGALGAVAVGVAALAGLVVLALRPGAWHRRRRSGLRYVEMGKAPVGLL
ncbi:hypothetical protein [Variovorax jilinensis]|uniref:hypothetical protein n=1 Tax=Variovorax jilinensis TaxID=3053513 RepID=UPI0025756159|nr:hypothetical protein [Variovorax sp. J22P168]